MVTLLIFYYILYYSKSNAILKIYFFENNVQEDINIPKIILINLFKFNFLYNYKNIKI